MSLPPLARTEVRCLVVSCLVDTAIPSTVNPIVTRDTQGLHRPNVCIDICIDMCIEMCIGMCKYMCKYMCLDMCIDMA